ncbi:MAG: hypothetical protein AAB521_00535 [Patescibacteria group bacterium]
MVEKHGPNIDDQAFTAPLAEIQRRRDHANKVAQSVDGSENLAEAALNIAFARKTIKLPPSSSQ